MFVDGRYYGSVRMVRGGLAFEPGRHRLELRHEDYFSRYVELNLARSERKNRSDRRALLGPQPEPFAGARVWALPNPSGLNAHYQLPDLSAAYGKLARELGFQR